MVPAALRPITITLSWPSPKMVSVSPANGENWADTAGTTLPSRSWSDGVNRVGRRNCRNRPMVSGARTTEASFIRVRGNRIGRRSGDGPRAVGGVSHGEVPGPFTTSGRCRVERLVPRPFSLNQSGLPAWFANNAVVIPELTDDVGGASAQRPAAGYVVLGRGLA